MKPAATLLVATGLLCSLAGCRNAAPEPPARQPPARHRGTSTRLAFDRAEIEKLLVSPDDPRLGVLVFNWEDKPKVMVWMDGHFNGGAFRVEAPTMKYRASLSYDALAAEKAKWCFFELELQDATRAQFSAAVQVPVFGDDRFEGPIHDAENGACFLVSGNRGELRVKQMKVDMAKLEFTKKGMLSFASAEPVIKEFFAIVPAK